MPHSPDAFHYEVTAKDHGKRLDVFLVENLGNTSRNAISGQVRNGKIRINGLSVSKPSFQLKLGQVVEGNISPPACSHPIPENISLDVLHEDSDILIINKPPGMVTHPAPGHSAGTLVNALLHRFEDLLEMEEEQRAGIVHRLDKDTSGLMVVARHRLAQERLMTMFRAREIHKEYLALVFGTPPEEGKTEQPINRHPVDRKRMTVSETGKEALSFWRLRAYYPGASLLSVEIRTGRTHQIRVHLAHQGFPIVGDPVYGSPNACRNIREKGVRDLLQQADRQMLHAHTLRFIHPINETPCSFSASPPEDMEKLLSGLETWRMAY